MRALRPKAWSGAANDGDETNETVEEGIGQSW